MRIGKSTDIHRLAVGEKLIIGGVVVPSSFGSVAHSDGDCLLHAVAESIMGALGLGDLGTLFPDTDATFLNMDSRIIVTEVVSRMKAKGYKVGNIDTMVFLERPKLKDHIQEMRRNIADLLEISIDDVCVKATTGEKIGIIGTGEAIVCESVVLLDVI